MPTTEGALCAYANLEPTPEPTSAPATTTQGKPVAPHLVYSPLRKPMAAMSGYIRGPTSGPPGTLMPVLISIRDACIYLGGVSRSKFYNDILPLLDTVKIGKRNFVTTNSIDRLIAANQRSAQSQVGGPDIGATSAALRKAALECGSHRTEGQGKSSPSGQQASGKRHERLQSRRGGRRP